MVNRLVNAKVPSGWIIDSAAESPDEDLEVTMTRETDPVLMHCVVFFMTHYHLIDLEEEDVARTRDIFDLLRGRQYNPLIMLTKLDEVNKAQRSNPLGHHEDMFELKREVSEIFDVPFDSVMVTTNYIEETERVFEIDALAYENMQKILNSCKGFVEANASSLVPLDVEDDTD